MTLNDNMNVEGFHMNTKVVDRSRRKTLNTIRRSIVIFFACTINSLAAESLTLESAISAAMNNNPDLKSFNFNMKIQDARIMQAGLKPKPELNVNVEDILGTGEARGFSGSQTTLSIAWVVEGGLAQRRIDVARTGSLSLAAQAEIMRLDTAAQVARYYMQALALQLHKQLADEGISYATESISTIQKRVAAGTGSAADLARAEAQRARLSLYREDMDHELEIVFHQLAALWGELYPEFTSVEGDISELPNLQPFPTLITLIEQNPDISRFLSEQRLQDSILQLELAQRKTPWRFNAGIRRMQSSSDMGFVAGVTIPLNRGNVNQGRIQEARSAIEQTAAEKEAAMIRVQTNLFVVYQELEHNLHRVNVLGNTVIPKYQEALSQMRRSFELGAASYFEWLQIQQSILDARSDLIDASLQAQLKNIEIERLTGLRIAQSLSTQ